MENKVKLGPKVMKGTIWDDGGKTNIVQILISYGKKSVYSIQFIYDVNGKLVSSEIHGTPCGSKFDMVVLDDSEYLTSVSGQYCAKKLGSIKFVTNKNEYGPFGSGDSIFEYKFEREFSFGGFHGSVYNSCLCSIGVYVRPLGLEEPETDIDIGSDKVDDDQSLC